MKPHFFTKTGQKLVFLRKKKWTLVSETRKKCGSVSWNRVSFIKKVEFHKKRKFSHQKKVTFQITPDNVDYGLTSFNQKRKKCFRPNFSLTKKLDFFYYDQKYVIKIRKYGHIWGRLFPVSWNETEKKVTSSALKITIGSTVFKNSDLFW